MVPDKRNTQLIAFCKGICSDEGKRTQALRIISDAGVPTTLINKEENEYFMNREFHHEVIRHAKDLFIQGNYFHAVFEASKAYNSAVKEKAQSDRDGQALMMESWSPAGVLKITACQTETDRNVQDGIKFLSAGLMQAIRNPAAHEPAITWPISKQDCLDILSFISFLFRQLDKAVYFKS